MIIKVAFSFAKKEVSTRRVSILSYNYYRFVKELVDDNRLVVEYCGTKSMIADMLTKALPKEQHLKLTELAGLNNVP